jgi:hypothetical protein
VMARRMKSPEAPESSAGMNASKNSFRFYSSGHDPSARRKSTNCPR